MAIFKRAELRDEGFTEDQITYLMGTVNKGLEEYELKTGVQSKIDAAVDSAVAAAVAKGKAEAPEPQNILESAEYKALQAENAKLNAFRTSDFNVVKKPYQDIVWDKLDHSEKHASYAEQLTGLRETMPDLFEAQKEESSEEKKTPQFGSENKGSMPKGKEAPSFSSVWNFGAK